MTETLPSALSPAEVLDVADAIRTVAKSGFVGPISETHRAALRHLLALDLDEYERALVGSFLHGPTLSLPLDLVEAKVLHDLLDLLPDPSEADGDAWLAARKEAKRELRQDRASDGALPTSEVIDLLTAIREALTVPYPASPTAGREREWLFTDRASGVRAVISNIVDNGLIGPAVDASWWARQLRELTERYPVTYPTRQVGVRGGPDLGVHAEAEYRDERAEVTA